MSITEEHIFFECGGTQLFAVIFLPEEKLQLRDGYVICSPFAEEKKSSQRMLVDSARVLASKGFPILLFDYYACGDSEGDFKDVSLTTWIQNARSARIFLKGKASLIQVGFIGLRLGCYIAISASKKLNEMPTTVFIEPVFDPKTYFKKILRQKLMKELITDGKTSSRRESLIQQLTDNISIDFDGYEIGSTFYNDLLQHKDQAADLKQHDIQTLLIHVTPTGKTSRNFQKIIAGGSPNERLHFKKIQLDPFWERIDNPVYQPVIDEVTKFLMLQNES